MIKFNKKTSDHHSEDFELRIEIDRWELVQEINEYQLKNIRDDINDLLGLNEIARKFNISIENSELIKEFHDNEERCEFCAFKMQECSNCVLTCQSPLERELYLALCSLGLEVKLQQRINKDGEIMGNESEIDKDKILTIPDFFIAASSKNYCIYTDGHTYHERTEYQAQRDRNIDRELQLQNFIVLRYTGLEIREKLKQTAVQIYKTIMDKPLSDEVERKLDEHLLSVERRR